MVLLISEQSKQVRDLLYFEFGSTVIGCKGQTDLLKFLTRAIENVELFASLVRQRDDRIVVRTCLVISDKVLLDRLKAREDRGVVFPPVMKLRFASFTYITLRLTIAR